MEGLRLLVLHVRTLTKECVGFSRPSFENWEFMRFMFGQCSLASVDGWVTWTPELAANSSCQGGAVGGWGKRVCKDRAPQPGGRFIPSVRACAQCYSCRIRDEMTVLTSSLFPLDTGMGAFPFSLQDLSVGACLSKSE